MGKRVMYESSRAAQRKTVTGWVSRIGNFYGKDEHAARYDGCTHKKCSGCQKPVTKGYTLCLDCRQKEHKKTYEEMPFGKWDGESPLYSESQDKYFDGLESAQEYADEEGIKIEDLWLTLCMPMYVPELNEDFVWDVVQDGNDVPEVVLEAMNAFNRAVEGIVMCYFPKGERLKLT